MKSLLIFLSFSLFLLACDNQKESSIPKDHVIISGVITDTQADTVTLGYRINGEYATKSVPLNEGGFRFELDSIYEVVKGSLTINDTTLGIPYSGRRIMTPRLSVYLEPGMKIEISGAAKLLDDAAVVGGKSNSDLSQLTKLLSSVNHKYNDLLETYYTDPDTAIKSKAIADMNGIRNEIDSISDEFLKKNSNSVEAAYNVYSKAVMITKPEQLDSMWNSLGEGAQSSSYGKMFKELSEKMKNTMEGAVAPDFIKNQPDGTPFALSSTRGKYVLVDFWGSWCGPCRMAHPHLKKLYEKYKDRGFEIVGVAHEMEDELEMSRANWMEAIEEDSITWIQVLNDEGIDELNVADLYGIRGYPTGLLLDPDGVILLRTLGSGGTGLDEALEKAFPE